MREIMRDVPDRRLEEPEGGMVRESMRHGAREHARCARRRHRWSPKAAWYERACGMVRESMRDVPAGDTEEPEGGMVRESMRDVPESDTEEPDGRHGTREHAEREIGRWARSPPPRMKRGRYRRSFFSLRWESSKFAKRFSSETRFCSFSANWLS